jgi:nucleoside-diphosphate-sugar epimerase
MLEFKHVLVTGGAGYVGCALIPQLLEDGYIVTVYDILYYGQEGLPNHQNLTVIKGDIRNTSDLAKAFEGIDAVLHLACISNDASFELDENLSKTSNLDCFEPMVIAAKAAGVKRFVYASTSSVYGISDQPNVTEDHPLVPLTLYNDFKGQCEPLLKKHLTEDFTGIIIRPATVCGYSPRTRLDLTVNILTNHAITNGKITVFGGTQLRPNLHIQDMCDLYKLILKAPTDKIQGDTFNAGYQNQSVSQIAEIVRKVVETEFPEKAPIEIITTPSDDNRSYHINSDKIFVQLGFKASHTIEDAVRDLCQAFRDGKLPNSMDDDTYYNVRQMKALGAK